jgi:hypothetical protein
MTYTATTPTSPIAATIANNTNVVVVNSMTSSVRDRNEAKFHLNPCDWDSELLIHFQ